MDQIDEIVTDIDFTSYTEIIWSVPRFLILVENKITRDLRKDIENQQFNSVCSRFRLKMQFLGRDNDIIEVYYLSPVSVTLKTILTICLNQENVNFKRNKEEPLVTEEFHTVQANKWQYLATMFKINITDYGRQDLYLWNDDTLRLKFEFIVSNDKVGNITNVTNVPEARLSNNFESLLNNGLFSDVIMKSIEGTEFKVHKAVLASRSVVLKAHFEHNTTECLKNIVESPLEGDVLKEVLTFIYSDKAPSVDDIPEKLLAAADYYQLGRLKYLCEEALHKKLTVENAMETLQLADIHSAQILEKLTLEFIKDGHAKLIAETEGWVKVKSVDLIKTLYKYIMNDDVDTDIK